MSDITVEVPPLDIPDWVQAEVEKHVGRRVTIAEVRRNHRAGTVEFVFDVTRTGAKVIGFSDYELARRAPKPKDPWFEAIEIFALALHEHKKEERRRG